MMFKYRGLCDCKESFTVLAVDDIDAMETVGAEIRMDIEEMSNMELAEYLGAYVRVIGETK